MNTTCNECGRKGHLAKVCKTKKLNKKKDVNSINNEPDTPKPPIEGETATMGFFFNIESRKPALSHVGINSFGNWATIKIEEHPEVEITIKPEVPSNTFRTTLDAWNGYHSVPIKEEDRDVTTFITPWGRFRYRTTPQGFLAAQDKWI